MRFMNVVARLAFGALVVALVVGLVASVGTRFHIWDFRVGLFKIFPFCLGLGAAALLLGLAWVVTALLLNTGKGARYGVVGFVGAIILLANPAYDIAVCRASPRIHDISTDVEHPPEFVALLTQRPGAENPPDYDGPNVMQADGKSHTVMALQKKFYPEIHPVGQLISPEQLFARALATAQRMGWDIVAVAAGRRPHRGDRHELLLRPDVRHRDPRETFRHGRPPRHPLQEPGRRHRRRHECRAD